jgi:hypothetical protein
MQREMLCALTIKTGTRLSPRRHSRVPRQPLGQTVTAIHRRGHQRRGHQRRAVAMRPQGHRRAAAMRRLVHRPAAVHRHPQRTLSLPLRAMAIVRRPKSSSGQSLIKGPLRRI